VVDGSYRLHAEASAYLAALRGLDRSPNTERVYAGRLALFLSYCAASRISWQEIEVAALVRFLRWLVTEPLPSRGSESPVRYRRAATANAVLTTVCEFLRFAAARGWVPTALVARLSHPKQLRHLPGHDLGEAGQFATVRAKWLKLREVPVEIEWLTAEQVDAVIAATWRGRDRFLVSLLAATGMRIGEALGLRREDLHLLANGAPVGCSTDGPHVHIRRRRNENGAIAKSRYPRSVPVLDGLVGLYADYQHERFATAGAESRIWYSSICIALRSVLGCSTARRGSCSSGCPGCSGFGCVRTCCGTRPHRGGSSRAWLVMWCSTCSGMPRRRRWSRICTRPTRRNAPRWSGPRHGLMRDVQPASGRRRLPRAGCIRLDRLVEGAHQHRLAARRMGPRDLVVQW
jgi:integrase